MANGVRPPLPTGGVKREADHAAGGEMKRGSTSPYGTPTSLVGLSVAGE